MFQIWTHFVNRGCESNDVDFYEFARAYVLFSSPNSSKANAFDVQVSSHLFHLIDTINFIGALWCLKSPSARNRSSRREEALELYSPRKPEGNALS